MRQSLGLGNTTFWPPSPSPIQPLDRPWRRAQAELGQAAVLYGAQLVQAHPCRTSELAPRALEPASERWRVHSRARRRGRLWNPRRARCGRRSVARVGVTSSTPTLSREGQRALRAAAFDKQQGLCRVRRRHPGEAGGPITPWFDAAHRFCEVRFASWCALALTSLRWRRG